MNKRKSTNLTVEKILRAIKNSGRDISAIAEKARCDRTTVNRYLQNKKFPEIKKAFYKEPLKKKETEFTKNLRKDFKKFIPKCKGDKNILSRLMGKTVSSINRHLQKSAFKVFRKQMADEVIKHGTHSQKLTNNSIKKVLKVMKGSRGKMEIVTESTGLKKSYISILKKQNREIKNLWEEEKRLSEKEKTELKKLNQKNQEEKILKESTLDWEKVSRKFLPHQIAFADISPREIKHPALVGGFGSGKTMAAALRWLKLIDFRIAQKKECDIMILEPTKEMIDDIIVPSFDDFFESLGIEKKYSRTTCNYTIFYRGKNRTAKLRSANKPHSLTGKNLTDFIIDEFDKLPLYKQKVLWRECVSRIRKAKFGTGAVVTTPEGYKMTHHLWVEKKNKNFSLIKAKTSDNFYLPDDFVQNLYEQFDSRLVKQYIEGEFVNIESDLVYYCFEREQNVIDAERIRHGDDARIILGFDFNVNPVCAAEIIMNGRVRLQTYEYKISNSNTKQLCEMIMDSLRVRFGNIFALNIIITGDASGNSRSTSGEETDFAIIKKMFDAEGFNSYLFVKPSNPPVRERVNFVNALFEKKQFFISENCGAAIKDRELVSWKKGSEKFVIDKSDRELTHLSEAADYALWATRWIVDSEENKVPVSVWSSRRKYF